MTVLLEPRLQCRRMFLGSVKLKKLSIVKAWIGSLSLKRRFSVHVCSIQYIKKKMHSSANPLCDKKMALEDIFD